MSKIVPPLLSNSPPPMVGVLDEEEEDEFGDFAVATDLSYGCDALSLPSSPKKSPKNSTNKSISKHSHDDDTNSSNSSQITNINTSKNIEKDHQDRRKDTAPNEKTSSESSVSQENIDTDENNSVYNNSKIKTETDNKYNSFQYFPEIPPDIPPENDDEEFADVDDQLDEFDDFQDFESSKNDIDDSVKNSSETVVDGFSTPVMNCVNPELSSVLADVEANSSKCDETEIDVPYDSVDINELETTVNNASEPCESIASNYSDRIEVNEDICIDSVDIEKISDPTTKLSDHSNKSDTSPKGEDEKLKLEEQAPVIQSVTETSSEDEFGDFENHFEPPTHDKREQVEQTDELDTEWPSNDADDDFGNFETPATELKLDVVEDPFSETKILSNTNNFGNFDNQFDETAQSSKEDDFGDFSNFPSSEEVQVDSKSEAKTLDDEDDEFGDFNDYSLQTQTSQSDSGPVTEEVPQFQRSLSLDVEAIPQKAESIVLEMFPVIELTTEDYLPQDFTKDSLIFDQLKDVTDTSALAYQWSKSNSQHFLLQALNIDTRNILYGPRWNESMPRYAATLGFTPLEPVKSDMLTPTAADPCTSSSPSQTTSGDSTQQTDIPSAQFDWVGSGLTNPLENSPASTMLLDLEQLVASLDIQFSSNPSPKSPRSPSPVNDIDDWEFWLRLTPKKIVERQKSHTEPAIPTTSITKSPEIDVKPIGFEFTSSAQPEVSTNLQVQHSSEPIKPLQLHQEMQEETVSKVESTNVDFDDFSSFQSSKSEDNASFSNWSVPLRETHISNFNLPEAPTSDISHTKVEKPAPTFDEPGWLKPTILTPDLPRKETVVEEELHEEEDEFADFQTSQPVTTYETDIQLENKPDTGVPINPNDDDEFTDFQSILPSSNPVVKPTCVPPEPLQPSPAPFEPLKPSVLQPTISANAPAAINWPDPGITDDDLKHIELFYKPNITANDSEELQIKSEVSSRASSNASKSTNDAPIVNKTEDDDDWSDFVSNQGPTEPAVIPSISNLNKTTNRVKQPSRTSTPELQLCIPQLNQIQPPKKPVPIITQQGLVQTKLSSNLPITIEPLVQPSVQQVPTYPHANHLQNGFQPSLISNQYAAQFGQGLMYSNTNYFHQSIPVQSTAIPKQIRPQQYFSHPQPPKPLVSSNKLEEFDDEWTDFVSSQPAPSSQQAPSMISNGLPRSAIPKPNFDWNRPPQFTSWSTNVTPNIITNPVSFDTFQSYSSSGHSDLLKSKPNSKKNPNVVVQPKKNTVPSISSVPDLEFIAPKNKTWKK